MLFIKNNYIYVHIPKTGGRFVEETCRKMNFFKPELLTRHSFVSDIDFSNFKFVSTIRNPWDWYVSDWNFWKGKLKEDYRKNKTSHFYHWKYANNFNEHLEYMLDDDEIRKKAERNEELKIGDGINSNQSSIFKKMHEKGCGYYTMVWKTMCFKDNKDLIDIYMKTDNLNKDFIKAFSIENSSRQKMIEEMDRVNTTIHRPYWVYYSDKTRELVAQKEKEMIEKFNFVFK